MTSPLKKNTDFDKVYRSSLLHWVWTDARIPPELKALIRALPKGSRVLELGCGVGRFSRYVAKQGLLATGVDFSSVAISKAQQRAAQDAAPPDYQVGDVTQLEKLSEPFDASFDVGCFHCLDAHEQRAYVAEVARLLKPGGTHLIWAMDAASSGLSLSPVAVRDAFASRFTLQAEQKNRRRLVRSHWYRLVRAR